MDLAKFLMRPIEGMKSYWGDDV